MALDAIIYRYEKKIKSITLFELRLTADMLEKCFWLFCTVMAISYGKIIFVTAFKDLELLEEESFKVEPHIFENKILEAVNKFKDLLSNGDRVNGIPPLDPYFLSYQEFEFYITDIALKGYFQNTTFTNFSDFEVESIEFRLIPLHFKLDLLLDRLMVFGRYKIFGDIFNEIPVNGSGKFTSETKNLTLSLYLRPTKVNSSLQIKDLIFEFKTLNKKINYTNELLDGEVRALDENLVLYTLNQVQGKCVPPLLNIIKLVLNHFLLGYSFADIMKIIFELLNKN